MPRPPAPRQSHLTFKAIPTAKGQIRVTIRRGVMLLSELEIDREEAEGLCTALTQALGTSDIEERMKASMLPPKTRRR